MRSEGREDAREWGLIPKAPVHVLSVAGVGTPLCGAKGTLLPHGCSRGSRRS